MKLMELQRGGPMSNKPSYPSNRKTQGPVGDWVDAMGVSSEDLKTAAKQVQSTPEFKNVLDKLGATFESSQKQLDDGTLKFVIDLGAKDTPSRKIRDRAFYIVFPNGLIRFESNKEVVHWDGEKWVNRTQTRLASPKPHIHAGNGVKTVMANYKNALKELASKKLQTTKAAA